MKSNRPQSRSSWLLEPRLGVVCAGFTAAWLGFGSLLNRYAPNFHHRRVPWLWGGPGWHALWVFVLLVAFAFWCAHLIACLRAAWIGREPRGPFSTRLFGAFAALAALVLALGTYAGIVVAHFSEEFRVTPKVTDIHGESYRVLRIERAPGADRAQQAPVAWLERKVGSATEQLRVERGVWWSSRTANYELALARAHLMPEGAVFRYGDQTLTLDVAQPKKRGLLTFLLRGLHHHSRNGKAEVDKAELEVAGKKELVPLDPEWAGETAFLGMHEVPVVLLRVHQNRAEPLALLAFMLLVLGLGLSKLESRLRWGSRT